MGYVTKLNTSEAGGKEVFHLVLIKPTRYGDDGYSIHWDRSPMPTNSLACLLALSNECRDKSVLGSDVEIVITPIDETTSCVDCHALAREIKADGGRALVGMVGVQSNQFPRCMDLARQFINLDVPVCIGGFHVTGSLSMLPEPAPEIAEATKLGISLFLGEAEEGRLAKVLQDAYHGRMQPIYDFRNQLPGLEGEPVPILPQEITSQSLNKMTCMDLGRGCPFDCSFCCIINVQGRKSRFRSADDVEKILLENHKNGVYRYFITDDNFARNKNWESLLDRMIEVQRREGFRLKLVMQVDMLCHKVKGFIDKSAEAGAEMVFCGMENINPENLKYMKKPQNRISEYREMMLQWKKHSVLVAGGYIIGLPNDSRESVMRDVDTIKKELPLDFLAISIITPLPGSRDHQEMSAAGKWMDPDLNKYNLTYCVREHATMSAKELEQLLRDVYIHFYTDEHMETVLRRHAVLGGARGTILATYFKFYGLMSNVHKLYSYDTGLIRYRYRSSRRPGFPKENWFVFHAKSVYDRVRTYYVITREVRRAIRTAYRIWAEIKRDGYKDKATTLQGADGLLELYPQAAPKRKREKTSKQVSLEEQITHV